MLKQRIATGLLLATAVTALTAASAFAAEPPASEKDKSAVAYAMTAAVECTPADAAEVEADTDGGRPYELEDGIRVYLAEESDADVSMTFQNADAIEGDAVQGELKTDENGDQYFEMEDGARVYVMKAVAR